jgi:hypothetical protein
MYRNPACSSDLMQREVVFICNKTPAQAVTVKQAKGIAVPRWNRRPNKVLISLLYRLQGH